MTDNAKTINDIKNKVTNIANTTTKQILNVMDVDRDKLIKFMKNNYKKVLLLSFVVFIIIFYFIAIFRRVPDF